MACKTMVRISRAHLTKLQELAALENRSATNYLETLVNREYKKLNGGMNMKNWTEIYKGIDEDVVVEKLKEMYREAVGYKHTSYTQNLVLNQDGELEIYRLGQNESLQSEFRGEALTILSTQEFDITDIEGWEKEVNDDATDDELLECYISETFQDWYYASLEEIESNLKYSCR